MLTSLVQHKYLRKQINRYGRGREVGVEHESRQTLFLCDVALSSDSVWLAVCVVLFLMP